MQRSFVSISQRFLYISSGFLIDAECISTTSSPFLLRMAVTGYV